MAEEETYVDTLNGTGWIPGIPGMHSHGSRIIRDSVTHEIVDVLPPRAVEETTLSAEQPAELAQEAEAQAADSASLKEEPAQEAPQEAPADNPIQVHVAVVNTSDVPPEPVQPQADTLQDAMQRLNQ